MNHRYDKLGDYQNKKAEIPITGTDFAYITTQIITSQNINLKS